MVNGFIFMKEWLVRHQKGCGYICALIFTHFYVVSLEEVSASSLFCSLHNTDTTNHKSSCRLLTERGEDAGQYYHMRTRPVGYYPSCRMLHQGRGDVTKNRGKTPRHNHAWKQTDSVISIFSGQMKWKHG